MIVLDASATVELLLGTPVAAQLAKRLAHETLHSPHVVDLEVTSALRTLEKRKVVTPADATRATAELLSLRLARYPHDPLVARIWQLRGHVTPYDAAYIALAEHLAAPLITCDARLAAAPGHTARIELFS